MIDGAIPDREVDLLGFDGIFPGQAGISGEHFPVVEAARISVDQVVSNSTFCPYVSPDLSERILQSQPHGINGSDGVRRK